MRCETNLADALPRPFDVVNQGAERMASSSLDHNIIVGATTALNRASTALQSKEMGTLSKSRRQVLEDLVGELEHAACHAKERLDGEHIRGQANDGSESGMAITPYTGVSSYSGRSSREREKWQSVWGEEARNSDVVGNGQEARQPVDVPTTRQDDLQADLPPEGSRLIEQIAHVSWGNGTVGIFRRKNEPTTPLRHSFPLPVKKPATQECRGKSQIEVTKLPQFVVQPVVKDPEIQVSLARLRIDRGVQRVVRYECECMECK